MGPLQKIRDPTSETFSSCRYHVTSVPRDCKKDQIFFLSQSAKPQRSRDREEGRERSVREHPPMVLGTVRAPPWQGPGSAMSLSALPAIAGGWPKGTQ